MNYLPYIGGAMAIAWGLAHIAATKPVVADFGSLSSDSRRILLMEWIAEGIALCFIGLLVILTMLEGEPDSFLHVLVLRSCSLALIAFAVLSAFTGARTIRIPFRICPFVEMGSGILIFTGSF